MPQNLQLEQLLARALEREPRSLARLISRVEAGGADARSIAERLFERSGKARVIGLTGPPGVGKSTLTGALVKHYRRAGARVGVVAVDPSSPFSGGAILGDRIRMLEHFEDPEVFIRSMATRGHFGGLAAATADVIDVLDAAGFDVIITETIGVGQDDVEVSALVGTCVLVLTPGQGDEIQIMKGGIMEIGDVYAVNKADQPGVDRIVGAMLAALQIQDLEELRPVLRTVATRGVGIEELAAAIEATDERLGPERVAERQRARALQRVSSVVRHHLERLVEPRVAGAELWRQECERVVRREQTAHQAAATILEKSGLMTEPSAC